MSCLHGELIDLGHLCLVSNYHFTKISQKLGRCIILEVFSIHGVWSKQFLFEPELVIILQSIFLISTSDIDRVQHSTTWFCFTYAQNYQFYWKRNIVTYFDNFCKKFFILEFPQGNVPSHILVSHGTQINHIKLVTF